MQTLHLSVTKLIETAKHLKKRSKTSAHPHVILVTEASFFKKLFTNVDDDYRNTITIGIFCGFRLSVKIPLKNFRL